MIGVSLIDNTTIETVINIMTQGLDLAMTPPISYGIVAGLALLAIGVVGAWFKFRKKRA